MFCTPLHSILFSQFEPSDDVGQWRVKALEELDGTARIRDITREEPLHDDFKIFLGLKSKKSAPEVVSEVMHVFGNVEPPSAECHGIVCFGRQ